MTDQYWIGGFFIDLSRNQITQNKQSQIIPPKALAVLTYLAENQGKVVSQDTLLAEVWQDTVVSPNTLQRSIAQLRKALGDDGKGQIYIQTHAKRGYSLECDVRWHAEVDSNDSRDNANHEPTTRTQTSEGDGINKPRPKKPQLGLISLVAGIIVLGFIGFRHLATEPASLITISNIRSLTATDDKEFDATYTPDGKYIVFHRYLDKFCVNKLWAKNIETQQEIPLTKDWGAYGGHSFSQDGTELVFLATEACSEPAAQPSCYNLVSLDFEQALESPQQPELILQCRNSKVKKPIRLNNDAIALLQENSDRWKLISYSIGKNQSTDLYDLNDGNLVDYDYSVENDLIAVTSIHADGEHYIEMLKPDGRILSSHKIKRPPSIPEFRGISPSFSPLDNQLVFSTGRQFFTLSYDGEIAKVSLPFAERMIQPEFHPDGDRLLMIKGPYDSDISLLPLDDIQAGPPQSYPSFERSNLGEDYALFQPGGELIAFWSERSGEEQLWISDGDKSQQLTQFPTDTYIRGMDWAKDGQSLLVNANNVLTKVTLESRQQSFPMDYPVVQLFQWDSNNNSALVLVRIKGVLKFAEFDLTDSKIRNISDKRIKWALKSDDGRLIYKDHLDQFWQPGAVEAQLISPLNQQGGKAKSFAIDGNVIYAINSDNFMWSYDLDSEVFTVLGEVGAEVDYLTDIHENQLLLTVQIAAKKEVVELSIKE